MKHKENQERIPRAELFLPFVKSARQRLQKKAGGTYHKLTRSAHAGLEEWLIRRLTETAIIHGPNGFGKTVLLRMLDGLFNNRYSELSVSFRKLEIRFDDNSAVRVDKTRNAQFFQSDRTENSVPFQLPGFGSSEQDDPPVPDWFIKIQESPDIRLIMEQRLQDIQKPKPLPGLLSFLGEENDNENDMVWLVPMVRKYSEELTQTIRQKIVESAKISQFLDKTFPARLVKQMGNSGNEEEIPFSYPIRVENLRHPSKKVEGG